MYVYTYWRVCVKPEWKKNIFYCYRYGLWCNTIRMNFNIACKRDKLIPTGIITITIVISFLIIIIII